MSLTLTPITEHLKRWNRLISQLADPSVEMTVEEMAPLAATFLTLRNAGHQFDPALSVVMRKLIEQLRDGRLDDCLDDATDSDEDASDDPDEDGWDLDTDN